MQGQIFRILFFLPEANRDNIISGFDFCGGTNPRTRVVGGVALQFTRSQTVQLMFTDP